MMQFDMLVCSVLAPSWIEGDSQHHREYVTVHRWLPDQPPTYVFTKCFPPLHDLNTIGHFSV